MIKKIIIVLLTVIVLGGTFMLGRQVGLNTEESKTQTIITEAEVSANTYVQIISGLEIGDKV